MSKSQQQQTQLGQADIFRAQIVYREWGRRFTVLQQYLKGIHYYEKSSEYGDENFLWTLLGLSEALKKSGRFAEAAVVAEKCMRIDPAHLGANWTRMEALFDVAEFCGSLVCAHQGARHRQHFRAAVLLANEIIEDCVGENVPGDTLRQLQPWIRRLTEHREGLIVERRDDLEDEFQGIDEEQSRFRVDDPPARLRRYRNRMDRLMAGLYLGSTARDKEFLERLLSSPAVVSANKSGSARLVSLARDCLVRLNSQQEALRTRRPLYAVRARVEAALSEGHKMGLEREIEFKRCLVENEAKLVLRRLHEARLRRDYSAFFKMVERAKEKFESYSPRLFPEQQRYLNALYLMVARAYIDPRNLTRVSADEDKCKALLRRLLGLKGSPRLPRDPDLAWPPSLNVKRSFNTYRQRLALTNQPLEILWIFHELCKLFLEIRRYDLARFYAKKTRDLSLESNHEDWALNASHVLIRIELAQHNRNEAKEAAVTALESARKLNVYFLEDFYERAIDYIDGLDFGRLSDDDSIAARRKLVSSLMTADMKPSMDLLLRTMESVPARRRMSVMPGCKPKNQKLGLPTKRMTVRSGPPKDFDKESREALLKKFAPSKKIIGWLDFDDYD
ncbi:tetratricopeptide repeat protein 25-like isoform X1 [Nasonia vitripennis]|uniref:Tetratricopeptide repeat protein 25 n=1 Tax=Nasonia vitripennis TaxID=7425 RepID=A0A7M7LRY4_NASVI|nr:tetratricopeptide repeat protein 25-like isoform X1 [Nasonia vitripennis]